MAGARLPGSARACRLRQTLDARHQNRYPGRLDRAASITLGAYQVRDRLGEGGSGQVYRADGPDGPVAIKVLSPSAELDDAARARFGREARALAALRHPALVALLDHGVDDELGPYLVLPLLPGSNLRALIGGRGLGPEAAVLLGAPVADAVAAMHAAGLVHRDIKPDNIVAGPDGRVTLIDLGLAWSATMTRHTESGTAVGTIGYMAPEQIEGRSVGAAVDVWALGVVLHEWTVGPRPFARPRPGEEVAASLVGVAPSLTTLDRRVDDRLGELVARCLSSSPDARPTAREVADQLAALAAERSPGGDAARAAVIADPVGFAAQVAAGRASQLADEARAALADGRPFAALAACDRGLAHVSDDAALLALVAAAESASTRPVVTAEIAPAAVAPTVAWPRARRWPWLAGGGALIALSAAAVLALRDDDRPAPPPPPAPSDGVLDALAPEDRALARDVLDLFGRAVDLAGRDQPADPAAPPPGPPPTTATGWLARSRREPAADALISVRRALALAPTWPAAHHEQCRLLVELEDPAAGVACDQAATLSPDDAATRGLRAITLGRRGDLDRALFELTAVIAVDGEPAWRAARAEVQERRGDLAAAAADLRSACALGLHRACR